MAAPEQVRIERAIYGGAGLARTAAGAVALVPFTLPGELVEITAPAKGNEAELLNVFEPAASRVGPRCPHFGACGGCQYQHASYDAQLAMKQAILLETMERAGIRELPFISSHSGEPWEYRNRVRFRIAEVDGVLRVGYSVRGTNDFLPIKVCPIAAPLLVRAAFTLLELAREQREAGMWMDTAREVEFFQNETSSALNMTLYVAAEPKSSRGSFERMCVALQARLPELRGASAARVQAAPNANASLAIWGDAGLLYRAAGEGYWITRGGFFQVDRFLIDTLVTLVCEGRGGSLAWDLYAGVGLFSRILAQGFAQVTTVEANPTAVADLRAALARLGPQHAAVQAATLAFLRQAVVQRERPGLIVLDPPRAGAGAEACDLLLRLAPREMVYVSCDPATLARDLAVLQNGYRITAMRLVDLFPQTFHMETVVVLERRVMAH